jgi:hypothetical protein
LPPNKGTKTFSVFLFYAKIFDKHLFRRKAKGCLGKELRK